MKKSVTAIVLAIVVGMTGIATAQTIDDENLNGVYAFDRSNNFFGATIGEQQTIFGTVDSIEQLNLESTQVCYHYVTQESQGFLGMDEETVSELQCQSYDELDEVQQRALSGLSEGRMQDNMTQQNQTQNSPMQ